MKISSFISILIQFTCKTMWNHELIFNLKSEFDGKLSFF